MSRAPRPLPAATLLRAVFRYDPSTGLLYWKTRTVRNADDQRWNSNFADTPAGTSSQGYIRIELNGLRYLAHRLIYKYLTDDEPPPGLHHINNNTSDNRLSNLSPGLPLINQRMNDGSLERRAEPGDIWRLGPHRLMCGDSTKTAQVTALMDRRKASVCVTSPPYLQQRDYGFGPIDFDALMLGSFANLPLLENGQILVNLGIIYRNNRVVKYWEPWVKWMESQGWREFAWYTWDAGWGLPGYWNGRLAPSHEMVFHFNKTARAPRLTVAKRPENIVPPDRNVRNKYGKATFASTPEAGNNTHKVHDSVFRVHRHTNRTGPQKQIATGPAQLWVEMLEPYTNPGELCYEPFCGSGTAIVAAHRLDRVCYAMEVSPSFCDLAIARIEKDTGLVAIKVGNVPPDTSPVLPEIVLSERPRQGGMREIVAGLGKN